MKYIRQSRLKLAFYAVHLLALEAVIKIVFPALPLTELFTAQGLIIGGYLGAKTINNVKGYANGKENIGGD